MSQDSLGWWSQKEDLREIKGLWWSLQVGRQIVLFSEVNGLWMIYLHSALPGGPGGAHRAGCDPGWDQAGRQLAYSRLSAFCRPAGFALGGTSTSFNLDSNFPRKAHLFPFIGESTETQRDLVTGPDTHSQVVVELGFEPRRAPVLFSLLWLCSGSFPWLIQLKESVTNSVGSQRG